MEQKRKKCWTWRVQISDCRYRPLDQLFDHYNPRRKNQTNEDYFIHEETGWTDAHVKQFRRNIREQNICVRHGFPFYSRSFENKSQGELTRRKVKQLEKTKEKIEFMEQRRIDFWVPGRIRYPSAV